MTLTERDRQYLLIGALANELAAVKGWDYVWQVAERAGSVNELVRDEPEKPEDGGAR